MCKRPIVIACIGYILGIIYGLYFIKISIALFFIILTVLIIIRQFINTNSKRYLRIFIPKKAVIIFFILFVIGCLYVTILNQKYEKIYNINEPIIIKGIITKIEEKEYSNKYVINVKEINGKKYSGIKFLMYMRKSQKSLKFGDYIEVTAQYEKPADSRNYKGFSYKNYLKQNSIYGIINPKSKVNIIKNNKCNFVSKATNNARNFIIERVKQNLSNEASGIFIGILLGEKSQIPDEVNTYFKDSNMAHILAVSGAHISYIILTVTVLLNKAGKRISRIVTIIILMFFMVLTNFSPSVVRACIMSIIALIAKLIYRRSDIYNNLAISCLFILLCNPYNIVNVGFQLSFLGTLAIVLLNDKVGKSLEIRLLKKQHKQSNLYMIKYKLKKFVLNIIVISICVQLLVVPIMIINFNTFSLNFLISGVIATPIFAGIMMLGIISLLLGSLGTYLFPIIEFLVNLLIFVSKFISSIPYFSFIVKTPNIIWIISYYFVFILIIFLKGKMAFRIIKSKHKINKILKSIICILPILCIITQAIQDFRTNELEIHFIDVGQGDSCLIITPNNKTILIDGGGSADSDYDIGKNVLVPYLLDRRINSIDYIVVSHFDNDHCGGLMYVLEVIKVKNILISKQSSISEEYKTFIEMANKKNIRITVVKQGDVVNIEKNVKMQILYPTNNLKFDDLNNNSIVAKLVYKDFSMLFTGDIEEEAEREILNMYSNKILKSTILKVAHHGSKTSSTEGFLNAVNPRFALIGVGKDNNFGHPNGEVLEGFKKIQTEVFRTDKNGEITIITDGRKIGYYKTIN